MKGKIGRKVFIALMAIFILFTSTISVNALTSEQHEENLARQGKLSISKFHDYLDRRYNFTNYAPIRQGGTGNGSGGSGSGGSSGGSSGGTGSGGSGSGSGGSSGTGSSGGRIQITAFADVFAGELSAIYKDNSGMWVSWDDYVQIINEQEDTTTGGIMYYHYMKIYDGGKDALIKGTDDYNFSSHKYVDAWLYDVNDCMIHDEMQTIMFLNQNNMPFLYEYKDGVLKKIMHHMTAGSFMYWPISSTGVSSINSYDEIKAVAQAHDFADFSAATSPDNWTEMFDIGANLHNHVGGNYDRFNAFPFTSSYIKSLGYELKGGGSPFRNLKNISQILGNRLEKNQKLWDRSLGIDTTQRRIFNTNEVLDAIFNKIGNVTIGDYSRCAELLSLSGLGVEPTNVTTGFLTVNGLHCYPRYVYSASPEKAGCFTNSYGFGRDVTPDSKWDLAGYLRRWNGRPYTQNAVTAIASDAASQSIIKGAVTYEVVEMGIKTYIIACQNYPEFMEYALQKGIGGSSCKTIQDVNALAESDFAAWYALMEKQTKWFFTSFAVSNFATELESCTISIAKDGQFYCNIGTGRGIPVESEVVVPVQDLVLSNDKNKIKDDLGGQILNTISWDDNTATNAYGLPTNGYNVTSYVSNQPSIGLDEDNILCKDFIETDTTHYMTTCYVGRVPSADETTEIKEPVTLKDFDVQLYAAFNEEAFDAKSDDDKVARELTNLGVSTGSATYALQTALQSFVQTYNIHYLVNGYRQEDLRIYMEPVRMKVPTEVNLKYFDGRTKIPMSDWQEIPSLDTPIPEGAIIEYQMRYDLPDNNDVENESRKLFQNQLYNKEYAFFTEYGSVLSANININIVPRTIKGIEENKFVENDWTKLKIYRPKLRDMWITKVEIYSSASSTPLITREATGTTNNELGIPCQVAPSGGRVEEITIPRSEITKLQGNSNTGQYTGNFYAKVYYKYFGKYNLRPLENWNRLLVNNMFTKTENYAYATSISGWDLIGDGARTHCLQLNLNEASINETLDDEITITVPKSINNQCFHDWEVIKINLEPEVAPKDNKIMDIMLTDGSLTHEYGEYAKNSENPDTGYQLLSNGFSLDSDCNIVVAVKRKEPSKRWDEARKDGSLDGTLVVQYIKNDGFQQKPETVVLSEPTNFESLRYGQGKRLGYSKNGTSGIFCQAGDIMYYVIPIGDDVKNLIVTACFRAGTLVEQYANSSYDTEDRNKIDNTWVERFRYKEACDFNIHYLSSEDSKNTYGEINYWEGRPSWQFTVGQEYAEYVPQGQPIKIDLRLEAVDVRGGGRSCTPEEVYGLDYFGNGIATYTFPEGITQGIECYAVYPQQRYGYGLWKFVGHINLKGCNRCYGGNHLNEVDFTDNYIEHDWNIYWLEEPTPAPNMEYDYCSPYCGRQPEYQGCYPLGVNYEWDVKFRWEQRNTYPYEAVGGYDDVHHPCWSCETTPAGNPKMHIHCSCWCSISYAGPNDGHRQWRSFLAGGLYFERHELHIYCWSSASGTRDITNGSTVVFTGEEFQFWYESKHISNRDSLPKSEFAPFSDPYDDKGSGRGRICGSCNYLKRYPNVKDVEGPKKVRIVCSGVRKFNFDRFQFSPEVVANGSVVNKTYRWYPYPKVYVPPTNQNQTINLYMCSCPYKGHYYDTDDSVDNTGHSRPGYAWDKTHVYYCGSVDAAIYIRPSTTLIGTSNSDFIETGSDTGAWVY